MRTSYKMGAIPWLSWLWDRSPLQAAFVVLLADFGIMMFLMVLEGLPPWQRSLYVTVLWNDALFYPVYAAMVVVIMRTAKPQHGFYTEQKWHVGLLIAGFLLSLSQEWNGMRNGEYSMSQELSPSKLWHTLIFGVMFYWLVSPLIPIFVVRRPKWTMVVVWVCIIGTLTAMCVEVTSPFPANAHLEWTWFPPEGHVRK